VNPQEPAYRVATEIAGVVALVGWSTVRVTGADRASFLHNMCTNDIRNVAPGSGCEAFFTDVKGKIVAHAFVLVGDDALDLLMVLGSATRLIAHLDRYIIREDVQLADASEETAWTLVVGAKAEEVIGRMALAPLPELAAAWSHGRTSKTAVADTEVQLVRCDVPWCGGFLVGCAEGRATAVQASLADAGATYCTEALWQTIRIESAWPLWGADFDDANLPQEVGRDATAIHFRKGCYLGQETVARIDALGHVNKQLVQVRFAGGDVPAAGAELSQGEQTVGRVTSACWSPRLQTPLALAMVRRGANEPGSPLQCEGVPAEVVAPPTDPTAA